MTITINMDDKSAVVTGAASGLGRATAIKLASAGADVCIVDVNEDGLKETRNLMVEPKGKIRLHVANLSDPDACAPIIAGAVEAFGKLDALCNIAGIIVFADAHEMPRPDWDRTIAINLTAPFLLSQAAIPHLLATDGAIVNCSSTAAFVGEAYAVAYCASKAGLLQMTKAMAMEYVRKSIRINAVAPGGMMTNISANMTLPSDAEIDLIERYSGLRGLVEVDDVADQICMLAGPAGRGFHGACVTIDKGITAG